MVLAGANIVNEYQVVMNVKSHTSLVHSGYYIFSATFSIATLTPGSLPSVSWSRLSSVSTVSDDPMGLVLDPSKTNLYSFGYQSGESTSKVTRLGMADGEDANSWTYKVPCKYVPYKNS